MYNHLPQTTQGAECRTRKVKDASASSKIVEVLRSKGTRCTMDTKRFALPSRVALTPGSSSEVVKVMPGGVTCEIV